VLNASLTVLQPQNKGEKVERKDRICSLMLMAFFGRQERQRAIKKASATCI
jgi:hypothetical protein